MSKELEALVAATATLPPELRAVIEPSVKAVVASCDRRKRILEIVQDALSQLRLDIKYLVFDLEATRRERDAARQQLGGA